MKIVLFILAVAAVTCRADTGVRPDARHAYFRRLAAKMRVFDRAEKRSPDLSSRELFHGALVFCEAGQPPDRLDLLFDLAARMQDRDEESRGYGNFRWSWRDGYVMDYNAVEFCMEQALPLWILHRQKLTDRQRAKLTELITFSIQGCLRHRVRSTYTNIAIMNAMNLILLGETMDHREAFDEGVRRLNAFVLQTALFGTAEYVSPTYSAVDIGCLHVLHTFVQDTGVRKTTERLLRLFWSDLCVNAFKPALRLGGTHSRDYNYLKGFGMTDDYLAAAGVFPTSAERPVPVPMVLSSRRPDTSITKLAELTPRRVEQRWGEQPGRFRIFWAGKHIALGVSGACYHDMDIPMAVNFESTQPIPRGYFIADGRHDPYGRKKIPEGSGPHKKTLHLKPFWAGTQQTRDALGLVLYRPRDIPPETPTLESHFVLPADADEILINDEKVVCGKDRPFVRLLAPNETVFIRIGAGAAGIRVPWSRDLSGAPAKVAFVWDGDETSRACRVTVAHHNVWGLSGGTKTPPGAVFWVRVCDRADQPAVFAAERGAFRDAPVSVVAGKERLDARATGVDAPLALAVSDPFPELLGVTPNPSSAVLAVNGRDLGSEILADTPGLAERRKEDEQERKKLEENVITVHPFSPAVWEAESGARRGNMVRAVDPAAGGFMWIPGEPGSRGSGGDAALSWRLEVRTAGSYRLFGRVSTATPDDDSFRLSVTGKSLSFGPEDWHLGVTKGAWKWVPFPDVIRLPKGLVTLNVLGREDGAKLDKLFLSADITAEPED